MIESGVGPWTMDTQNATIHDGVTISGGNRLYLTPADSREAYMCMRRSCGSSTDTACSQHGGVCFRSAHNGQAYCRYNGQIVRIYNCVCVVVLVANEVHIVNVRVAAIVMHVI